MTSHTGCRNSGKPGFCPFWYSEIHLSFKWNENRQDNDPSFWRRIESRRWATSATWATWATWSMLATISETTTPIQPRFTQYCNEKRQNLPFRAENQTAARFFNNVECEKMTWRRTTRATRPRWRRRRRARRATRPWWRRRRRPATPWMRTTRRRPFLKYLVKPLYFTYEMSTIVTYVLG